MKRSYLFIAGCAIWFMSLMPVSVRAQINPLDSVNLQLRQMFSGLYRPMPVKDFLYDMSAHITDPGLFTNYSTDTVTSDTWYRLYWECFYMAYDTTWLPTDLSIIDKVNNINPDTIPMGILDFDFYRLKSNALTSSQYFIFDTVNNTLMDIPGRPDEPYTTDNIFSASPLFHMSEGSSVTFMIDPDYIFKDGPNNKYYLNAPYDLFIDFGDGAGKQRFDPRIVSYYTANYSLGLSYAEISTTIEHDGLVIKLSTSELLLGGGQYKTAPDYTYTTPQGGILVSVFGATPNCVNPGETKIVIYLAGFQMMDFLPRYRRDAGTLYDDMISKPKIANLKNFGYEFHVVTWNDSRINIQSNAMYVVALLDYLKQLYGTTHQFIIIGESMGGLVARYALCYMESPGYQNPLQWPTGVARGFQHNVRELITFDVPHQGANIPLSVQTFYDDALRLFGFMAPMSARTVMRYFNLFLDANAPKQMLIYHIDTKSGPGLYKTYGSHSMKTMFFNDLANLSLSGTGYPIHCKLIALSNGSLNGTPQMRFYNTSPRVPNDNLMDTGFELYARILWFHVKIYGGNLRLQTNPNGQGQIYQQNLGRWNYRLKLYWFGMKLIAGYNSVSNRSEYADVMPTCTSPGGYFEDGLESVIGNSTTSNSWAMSQMLLLNLFAFNSGSDGNGCWNAGGHIGINGLASINLNAWMCSDGLHFCFIPTQSGLDYGTLGVSQSLFHNIESDPHSTKFSNTEFDVISGMAFGDPFPIAPNMSHLNVKYENNEGMMMSNHFNYLPTCANGLYGHWLNREIGDQELHLDNFEAGWSSTYESYDWLYVNAFANGAYNYGGGGSILNGIYSRASAFSHTPFSGAFSTFNCGASAGHHVVNGLLPTEFNIVQTVGINCCNFYRIAAPKEPVGEESITIYPNPADGTQYLSIDLVATSEAPVQVTITDFAGRLIRDNTLANETVTGKQTFTIPLDEMQLAPGIYIVRVKTGTTEFQRKLIVQ